MFDFIKKLLEPQKEQELLKFSLEEFKIWFDNQTKDKLEDFSTFIEKQQKELQDLKEGTKEKTEELQNAKLQNENIPTKAISYMEGNRSSYVRLVNRFLEDIDPIPKDVEGVHQWLETFNTQVDEHLKSSARNYQILQQFFSREIQEIAKLIKNIEQEVKKVQDYLTQEGLQDIERIRDNTKKLQDRIKLKQTLKHQLKEEKELFDGIQKKKEKAADELKEFVESQEFSNHQEKIKEKENKQQELKNHKATLFSAFSSLDRALKKLTKVAMQHEELIVEYQYRPEKTILKDSNLVIVDILNQLKKSIESGGIALDDKKKTKSLAAIAKLDRDFFERYLGHHHKIHREIETIEKEIERSEVMSKHKEVLGQVEKIDREVDRLKRSLQESEDKDAQINLGREKEELEMLIKAVMKQDVLLKI